MNHLYTEDCIEGMYKQPKGSARLAFADPPYNIGYEYDEHYDDAKPPDQYHNWCLEWMKAVHWTLADDGTFWLAIGDEWQAELKILAREIGFHMRSHIVWYYTFGVNCTEKFTRSHAHLFYFVKHKKRFTFNADQIRVPSARQLIYNDKRANPEGRLPDDTWILRPQDLPAGFAAEEDTWHIPRIAGTFKQREKDSPTQMPEQLLGRIIRSCSNPGDLVIDPFAGSATTLVVAKKLARQYLGWEISPTAAERATKRLRGAREGDPLDGPIPQGG